jgi:hypothetical protein
VTAVPVVRTFVAGEVVLASYFNTNINGPIGWLLAPAILRVRQTAQQTLTSATFAALLFDVEDVDSTGMHSTVTNTTRATAVYPGWYLFQGGCGFTSLATPAGRRGVRWQVNGATINGSGVQFQTASTSSGAMGARNVLLFLNTGDYAEEQAVFEGGGTTTTSVTAEQQPSMDCAWVSN